MTKRVEALIQVLRGPTAVASGGMQSVGVTGGGRG